MSLTKVQILSAQDIKKEKVNIPEWDGDIWVKSLTGRERDAFEKSIMEFSEEVGVKPKVIYENMRAKLCVMTICDDSGALIFTEEDIEALGKKSAKPLSVIFDLAQKLSGLTEEDIKSLSKNSKSAP